MLKALLNLLVSWGRHTESKEKDTYVPQYNGQWVNKAKGKYKENWQWVEGKSNVVSLRNYWVNVFKQGRSNYLILVAHDNSEMAIEYVECKDAREVEVAIRIYTLGYSNLGKVTVDKSLMSEDSPTPLI